MRLYNSTVAIGVYNRGKWLVTPIYKPFRPFGRGPTTPFRGLIKYGYQPLTNWGGYITGLYDSS